MKSELTFFFTLCNKGLKSSFFGVNYISNVYKHILPSLNHNLTPVYVSPSANNCISLKKYAKVYFNDTTI